MNTFKTYLAAKADARKTALERAEKKRGKILFKRGLTAKCNCGETEMVEAVRIGPDFRSEKGWGYGYAAICKICGE